MGLKGKIQVFVKYIVGYQRQGSDQRSLAVETGALDLQSAEPLRADARLDFT